MAEPRLVRLLDGFFFSPLWLSYSNCTVKPRDRTAHLTHPSSELQGKQRLF